MQAKVQTVNIPKGKRLIVVSDIHGHLQNFQRLLQKVQFSQNDILIINGDILERGPQSLETLRYVMKLSQQYTVYQTLGNNDWLYDDLKEQGEEADNALFHYMQNRKHGIINEMCAELETAVSGVEDVSRMRKILLQNFKQEWDFLRVLPDVVETQNFIFVHAGLESENLQELEKFQCVKNDWFFSREISFSRWCVVGHFPVSLYDNTKTDCSVRIDRRRKLISIDGGCAIKDSGQLNALIIPEIDSEDFARTYVDDLPKATAQQEQRPSQTARSFHWPNQQVHILKTENDVSYCEEKTSGYQMWIPNSFLYEQQGAWYTSDCTDYQLEVHPGDDLSVAAVTSLGAVVKNKGVLGWYHGEFVPVDLA